MKTQTFFDDRTYTLTYVVYDEQTKDAVIIDPVLDYEPGASKTFTDSVDRVIDFVRTHELKPRFVLETHAHADHLSGSQLLKEAFPGLEVVIGQHITDVQTKFKDVFDLPRDFPTDGSQFDRLAEDGEVLQVGPLSVEVINTPGHTPACVTYKIEDAIFTGDALFMPDQGTGRCDFPGGSADDMYDSITERLYSLPDATRVFVGHDYQPGGREVTWETTIGESKARNVALPASHTKDDFVTWRRGRDQSLAAPKLLFQSVQVNVDAGNLPQPRDNQVRYLKIPINVFRPAQNPDPASVEVAEANPV